MNEEIDINSRDEENDKTKQVIVVVVEKEKVILIDSINSCRTARLNKIFLLYCT